MYRVEKERSRSSPLATCILPLLSIEEAEVQSAIPLL
ncbi:hypothetical protein PDIG_63380 [Penicillium digitatum PHI26]|uniref:Uncharacterized protein n=2 Tax=Penicillium digitatum TaxID=36651 RepID=K9FI34_PEND2|nr:hypothetical protein PDIP_72750 [Penicillium digitatum Pd1]EKV07651.1 hypothetical protein PDIP_72750 [Penicillium digitatum Pd1]EKV09205.1 hypothetical protein PDIG_63380 [Penicillium digitatum PHI26]